MKRKWTPEEDQIMLERFSNTSNAALAEMLNRSYESVAQHGNVMGLKKTEEYKQYAGRFSVKNENRRHRFLKGHAPYNKGQKMYKFCTPEAIERMKSTQFKKGHIPASTKYNYQPYLYERMKNGYKERVWMIQYNGRRISYLSYLCKHNGIDLSGRIPRLTRELLPGEIPKFEDIEIITRAENMVKNSLHFNYPPEVVKTILMIGKLQRQINKRKTA
jgi:hypothetical protein